MFDWIFNKIAKKILKSMELTDKKVQQYDQDLEVSRVKEIFHKELKANKNNAYLIARNIFNKNQNNKNAFSMYFNFLCDSIPSQDGKNDIEYYNQANTAFNIFKENTYITDDIFEYIAESDKKLATIKESLTVAIQNKNKEKQILNDNLLNDLEYSVNNLKTIDIRSKFDNQLETLAMQDAKINKQLLSDKQKENYKTIASNLQQIKSDFDKKQNQLAVDNFEQAYILFNESKSKIDALRLFGDKDKSVKTKLDDVIELLSKHKQDFLLPETVTYYNMIFVKILQGLNTEETKKYFIKSLIEKK